MKQLQSLKGMPDILPEDAERRRWLESVCAEVFAAAAIRELRTPILEPVELFVQSVGESSDIVRKEMYQLTDLAGRQLALRPEGTAAVVRALLQHSLLSQGEEARFWYCGPMFRQENTQKGRLRQFHQVGVEVFGVASPLLDAELIALNVLLLQRLGVTPESVCLNSLGDHDSRQVYRGQLLHFLKQIVDNICNDCRARMQQNPLRVLDCKRASCQNLYQQAPLPIDALSDRSKAHFDAVQEALAKLNVAIVLDRQLVRGLDYYNDTVFEIKATGLGAQNTISAGGRYDGLVASLGGPATPAFGFAAGIERILMVTNPQAQPPAKRQLVAWIALDDAARLEGLVFVQQLRQLGVATIQLTHKNSLKAQLRGANAVGAAYTLLRGSNERVKNSIILKNLSSGLQQELVYDAARVAETIFSGC